MGTSRWITPVALIAVVALLIATPPFLSRYGLYVMSLWAVMSIAAMGLNLTLGFAGQVSMAQAAFLGIGAYATAVAMAAGWPFFAALALSAILSFVIGWALGYPALRVRHHYLAFVTLAFSTLAYLVFRNEEWLTGGVNGISGIHRPTLLGFPTRTALAYCYLCLGTMAIVGGAVWWIVRSPWGRAFIALRENRIRAASLGVDTRRYTLIAFALGSALGGVAGSIYAPLVQYVDPNPFSVTQSLNLLLMVVVGGSGYLLGPFVGAFVAMVLPEVLRFAEGYYLIIYAALVIALMIFAPTGVVGLANRLLTSGRTKRASDIRAASQPRLTAGKS